METVKAASLFSFFTIAFHSSLSSVTWISVRGALHGGDERENNGLQQFRLMISKVQRANVTAQGEERVGSGQSIENFGIIIKKRQKEISIRMKGESKKARFIQSKSHVSLRVSCIFSMLLCFCQQYFQSLFIQTRLLSFQTPLKLACKRRSLRTF